MKERERERFEKGSTKKEKKEEKMESKSLAINGGIRSGVCPFQKGYPSSLMSSTVTQNLPKTINNV